MLKQIQKTVCKVLEEELLTVLAVCIVALGVLWARAESDASITAFIMVYPAEGMIEVTQPNGGETWDVGSNYNITWNSWGPVNNVKIELQRSVGGSWEEIVDSSEDDGSYPWVVTSPATTTAIVRVSKVGDDTVNDESSGIFTIRAVTSGGGGGGGGTVYYPPLPRGEEVLPPVAEGADVIELVGVAPKEIYSSLGAYLMPELETSAVTATFLVVLQPSRAPEPKKKIELLPRVLKVVSIQQAIKQLVLEVEIKPKLLPPGKYDLGVKVGSKQTVALEAIQALPGVLAAKWIRQSDYPTVGLGEEFELWVEFRNTGTIPWLRKVPAQMRLGTSRPRDRDSSFRGESWLSKNRLAMIDQDTLPGDVGRFTFKMKAPSKVGIYREYVEPVAELSEWVGPDWGVYWNITVQGRATKVAPSTGGEPTTKTPLIRRIIPSVPGEFRDATESSLRGFAQTIIQLFSSIGNLFSGWL
ncbi:hypothetical protein A2V68_00930 [candidate division Kazan bacterium RBG_13_50_9]|uniref:Uncharacterized protein n=1 Tax=candidate division Kazan bacterium RBG_13_50_9 TaxID=1798535 RepID=A0A1F4NSN6_UNCK3|nr:MAG: hypothetical protein A2V68_00930 [candidate division Kazan bacterium RBG_13_50_9]